MRTLIALVCALTLGIPARGQSAAAPDLLQTKLEKFAGANDDLQKHLPSFGCKETLVSQEVRGGKVKRQVQAAGELRVQRDSGGKLSEHFQATELNGKPIGTQAFKLPIFVSGGFDSALDYFQADSQLCLHYTLSGNRLDFESVAEAPMPRCSHHRETRGFALLNDDGDVTHLERRLPDDFARQRNSVPFGSIDLSRVELGGSSFLLSTHAIAELSAGKSTYRWEATYTGCRLFAVTVKIGPATELEPGSVGSGTESAPAHP